MSAHLAGKVVAVIGTGSDLHRAVAVQAAEAGANIALGTVAKENEFAVHSIANEVWSVGVEHFVTLMDATDPTDVISFADETFDKLGRCDLLVWTHSEPTNIPIEELSLGEWNAIFRINLDAPYVATQAFGRLMERERTGLIVFAMNDPLEADPAYRAAHAALETFARDLDLRWHGRGVHLQVTSDNAASVLGLLGD